jgi:hypothetical protein
MARLDTPAPTSPDIRACVVVYLIPTLLACWLEAHSFVPLILQWYKVSSLPPTQRLRLRLGTIHPIDYPHLDNLTSLSSVLYPHSPCSLQPSSPSLLRPSQSPSPPRRQSATTAATASAGSLTNPTIKCRQMHCTPTKAAFRSLKAGTA